jgi:hypothetical protein
MALWIPCEDGFIEADVIRWMGIGVGAVGAKVNPRGERWRSLGHCRSAAGGGGVG